MFQMVLGRAVFCHREMLCNEKCCVMMMCALRDKVFREPLVIVDSRPNREKPSPLQEPLST